MDGFDLSSTDLNETQNHDDFIVVWLSPNDVPSKLKSFEDYLKKFDSNESCINYIQEFQSERKILLVLMNFKSVSMFENFVQIQSIYVFVTELSNIEFNKEHHRKLVGIFENIDELIDRLRKDIFLTYRNDLSISISSLNEITIEQSLMNLHGNTLMFLWNQLFIYYLIKFSNIDNMKNFKINMLEQCRLEYKNNEKGLEKINEFDKNCSDDNILEWYTKDSFLYRLLNKALRTQNIELICKFQYCIILLYQKFQNLSKEQQDDPLIVYRGQILYEKNLQLLKLNIGHFFSINTIMSTSRNEQVALRFILGAPNGVIFKINLQNQISNSFKPFIDISKFSINQDEEEILFFVGTVFSIDSVEQENDSPWIIKLTLHNEISNHIEKLTDEFIKDLNSFPNRYHLFMKTDDFNMIDQYYNILTDKRFSLNNNPSVMMYIHLAFIFSNLGLYTKAIQLYLNTFSVSQILIDSPESKVLHIIIGYLYYHLSEYNNAFNYYGVALSLLDETNLLTSELYGHIGDLWKKIENEDIALSCYQEALKIANYRDIPSLPNIYRNTIDILKGKGNFDEVSVYEKQVKEINQNQYHIPTISDSQTLLKEYQNQLKQTGNLTSIQRAELLYKIGLHLMKNGEFGQALTKLLEAAELVVKEPPSWDRFPHHLSTLFDNIALLYLFHNDHLKALTMWKRGINIRSQFRSN